ncbi:hypothetical protein J3F83DRAFT_743065 [Trichoderma novae-zelandiae]
MHIPFAGRLSYGYLLLLISCLFASLLNATDIRIQKEPQGPLKVRLDYKLATRGSSPRRIVDSKNIVFSTHLTFTEPVSSITNGQLAQMLIDAMGEMQEEAKQYGYSYRKWPSAMSFFAFGHEIILSTSQKGPSFTYDYAASPVRESLAICSAVWREQTGQGDKRHYRDASCGEIMCAHQYYQGHATPLKDVRVRALTGFFDRVGQAIKFIPECGTGNDADWGCNLFVAQNNIDYLAVDTQAVAYDLSTLAGGDPKKDQIDMC